MKLARLGLAPIAALAIAAEVDARDVKGKAVEYKHGDVVLEGWLAWPDVEGEETVKRPGVLVFHEWRGHGEYVRRRAEQIAALGYVAFAADMYGKGVFAKDHDEASRLSGAFRSDRALMRSRAAAALDVLRARPNVDAKRVAAIGYCFGGSTALELARSGADLAAVVSFHGALDTPDRAGAKNVKAKVLVCHGADDTFIPAEDIAAFQAEMRDAGVDWQMMVFGGAVHSFTVKGSEALGVPGLAYNEAADRRSWRAMTDLFEEAFR